MVISVSACGRKDPGSNPCIAKVYIEALRLFPDRHFPDRQFPAWPFPDHIQLPRPRHRDVSFPDQGIEM